MRLFTKPIVCCRDCPNAEHCNAGWYCERTGTMLSYDLAYSGVPGDCPLPEADE
jgi:hypothetical protein